MIKFTGKQMENGVLLEYAKLGERVLQTWPSLCESWYPKLRQLTAEQIKERTYATLRYCHAQGITIEERIVQCCFNALAADNLQLSEQYIQQMLSYFENITRVSDSLESARSWITWQLNEEYRQLLAQRYPREAGQYKENQT